MSLGYYDRTGKRISRDEWIDLCENRTGYRLVKETTVGDYWISTVWLGLDHSFSPTGPPVIFETMVFNHDDGTAQDLLDGGEWMDRYATEAGALEGHKEMVERVRRHLP